MMVTKKPRALFKHNCLKNNKNIAYLVYQKRAFWKQELKIAAFFRELFLDSLVFLNLIFSLSYPISSKLNHNVAKLNSII